jgi:hypothetical protein
MSKSMVLLTGKDYGRSELRRQQERFLNGTRINWFPTGHQITTDPTIYNVVKQMNKPKTDTFKARYKRNEKAAKVRAKLAAIDKTSAAPSSPLPLKNNAQKRRRARAEVKLKEQMTRLAMPANALQRTVALYQAASKYECAVQPPLPRELVLTPRYLPRPNKLVLDRWGNPKIDDRGRQKLKAPSYRLVAYEPVPRDPGALLGNVKSLLGQKEVEVFEKLASSPTFRATKERVQVMTMKGEKLLACDPDGTNIEFFGDWRTNVAAVMA